MNNNQLTKKILTLLIILLTFLGCTKKNEEMKNKQKQNRPIAVVIDIAKKNDVPIIFETFGQITPQNSVNITSKVSGKIEKLFFKEGDLVKKGQILAKIDCAPLEKSINQAEAILKKDMATLENAQKNAKRFEELVQKGYAAQVDLDNAQTALNTAMATVEADRANLEYLKTQLSYCTITSPISGKTGEIYLDAGNLIKENDKVITTIQQITPIDAEFSLPEEKLTDVLNNMKAGKKIKTELYDQRWVKLEDGTITFVDNTIDKSTGSFKLKATFNNKTNNLWPGQFVNIKVYFGLLKDAISIPTKAVQKGQSGDFVWVILDNNTAVMKKVSPIYTYHDFTVITGLKEGEKVVIDGAIKLRPNAMVEIKKRDNDKQK